MEVQLIENAKELIHINRVAEPGNLKTVAAPIFFLNMILALVSESNFYK
jgi:hypothetical protein